jgi:hypothetical protein
MDLVVPLHDPKASFAGCQPHQARLMPIGLFKVWRGQNEAT